MPNFFALNTQPLNAAGSTGLFVTVPEGVAVNHVTVSEAFSGIYYNILEDAVASGDSAASRLLGVEVLTPALLVNAGISPSASSSVVLSSLVAISQESATPILGVLTEALLQSATVGSDIDLNEEVVEDIALVLVLLNSIFLELSESITVSGSQVVKAIVALLDKVVVAGGFLPQMDQTAALEEILRIQSLVSLALAALVEEGIQVHEAHTASLQVYAQILDSLQVSHSHLTSAQMYSLVASGMALTDIIGIGASVEVLEDTFAMGDALSKSFSSHISLLEDLALADTSGDFLKVTVACSESLTLSDMLDSAASLRSALEDGMQFIISGADGGEAYIGIVMTPDTYAITEYDNYAFNSSANFRGEYLLAARTGLYLMGGDLDNGEFITSKIKTASMDFESSNLKQVPTMYLGVTSDASVILQVTTDGEDSAFYQLDLNSHNLSTQVIDIGKGLRGRYWQFNLETKDNSTFDLDSIELFPVVWGRKK